jgi:hypothetical protein
VSRPDHKGRKRGGFLQLTYGMLQSAPHRAASGNAVKLHLHLLMLSKGNNGFGHSKEDRGRLYLSTREAASAIGVSRNTAAQAFKELIELGFLRMMTKGHFDVKGVATTWRLTSQPYPQGNMSPTNEWLDWQPEKKPQAQKLTTIGSKIGTPARPVPKIGSKTDPIEPDSRKDAGPVIEPYIYLPREGDSPSAVDPVDPAIVPSPEKLRARLKAYLRPPFGKARKGVQGDLAKLAGLTDVEVSSFKYGRIKLPSAKRIALAVALDEAERLGITPNVHAIAEEPRRIAAGGAR